MTLWLRAPLDLGEAVLQGPRLVETSEGPPTVGERPEDSRSGGPAGGAWAHGPGDALRAARPASGRPLRRDSRGRHPPSSGRQRRRGRFRSSAPGGHVGERPSRRPSAFHARRTGKAARLGTRLVGRLGSRSPGAEPARGAACLRRHRSRLPVGASDLARGRSRRRWSGQSICETARVDRRDQRRRRAGRGHRRLQGRARAGGQDRARREAQRQPDEPLVVGGLLGRGQAGARRTSRGHGSARVGRRSVERAMAARKPPAAPRTLCPGADGVRAGNRRGRRSRRARTCPDRAGWRRRRNGRPQPRGESLSGKRSPSSKA